MKVLNLTVRFDAEDMTALKSAQGFVRAEADDARAHGAPSPNMVKADELLSRLVMSMEGIGG